MDPSELGARPEKGKSNATDAMSPAEGSPVKAIDFGVMPDLELPAPAIPAPAHTISATTIANAARRSLALFSSPRLLPGSPRTRFDLSASPYHLPSSPIVIGQPLKPILNPPSTPYPRPIEYDITDQRDLSPPGSPVFAPRSDDEPHPERPSTAQRTPHPLYTPVDHRRGRRRRKARSVASGRTSRSGRSARSSMRHIWKTFKKRLRRSDRATSSIGYASTSSSTSTSRSNGSSNSTWNGWRFWKNSSSGSSSSDSSDTEEEWEPPMPHFTLLTPCLSRTANPSYPSHLLPGAPPRAGLGPDSKPVFDLVTTSTITPVLDRLQTYWTDRKQEDGLPGDLGAGAMGTDDDAPGYFPHANVELTATPAVTPGIAPARKLRGEEKAAKAAKRRGTAAVEDEGGPAWWLDIMCPTVADLRELRKVLPLHPLTMEDIIHQETREKIETFPTLGYYFIVFRALDESYFKYTSSDSTPATAENLRNADTTQPDAHSSALPGSTKRARVDFIEGVGGKEGVEGVGVGAVNLYLIVFRDGIVSFHFEDTSKHVDRVQGKLQQFGATRSMSANWIAYGLMDSIVDAFFPLIEYVEAEANEVATFLADPLNIDVQNEQQKSLPPLHVDAVKPTTYDTDITGIAVDDFSSTSKKDSLESLAELSNDKIRRFKKFRMATIKRSSVASVLRVFPVLTISPLLSKILPPSWTKPARVTLESTMLVDAKGFKTAITLPVEGIDHEARIESAALDPKINRAAMLKKIADTRKLVTGLSRLMGPKADVVRGLRKRAKNDPTVKSLDAAYDISIYIGDLLDHSIAMQQSLNFFEAILSHDHLAYLGVLRLSLHNAKGGIDEAIVKLYIVTLTILPMNVIIGLFSLNIHIPADGARGTHLEPDGVTLAGFRVFYTVLGVTLFAGLVMWFIIFLIFRSSHTAMKKRGPRVELGTTRVNIQT